MNHLGRFYPVCAAVSVIALALLVIWALRPETPDHTFTQPPTPPPKASRTPAPRKEIESVQIPRSLQHSGIGKYDLQPELLQDEQKGSISGKVSDSQGNTLGYARVSVVKGATVISSAFTDLEGNYCVRFVPPGTYDVVAELKGFAKSGRHQISLPKDAHIGYVNIVLMKGGSFCGQVTTFQGELVRGAQVRIYILRQLQEGESVPEIWRDTKVAFTDTEGKFSIETVAPGEYEALATHPEYLPSDKHSVRIEPEKTSLAKFFVEPGGEISGTIIDGETIKPVEKAQIFLAAQDHTILARGCLTDPDGKYRLTGLSSGTVNIRVIAQGFISQTRQNIDVVQGRKIEEINFILSRGSFVSGTVLSEDGNPLAGATVSSTDATSYSVTTTDAEGRFKLEGLSSDKVALAARASGYSLLIQRGIEPNTENIALTLKRAGDVSGRVIANQPLPEFVIILYAPAPQPGKPRLLVTQAVSKDPQGTFALQDVPPGKYTVECYVPGFTQINTAEVTVHPAETTAGVEVLVEKSTLR